VTAAIRRPDELVTAPEPGRDDMSSIGVPLSWSLRPVGPALRFDASWSHASLLPDSNVPLLDVEGDKDRSDGTG